MFNCPICGSKEGIYFHSSRRYVSTPGGIETKVVGDPHISCLLCHIKRGVDKLSKTKEFGRAPA